MTVRAEVPGSHSGQRQIDGQNGEQLATQRFVRTADESAFPLE